MRRCRNKAKRGALKHGFDPRRVRGLAKHEAKCAAARPLVEHQHRDNALGIDLAKPDQPNQIELGRKDDSKVHRLFLDPTGSHVLISLSTSECLYLNRNTQKVRSLSRWRGHLIESVGWNKLLGNETSTGPILVGTGQGIIFEAEISASEGSLFNTNPDQYFRQVHSLEEDGKPAPVCCLEVERGLENKYFIIATTRKRLFQFVGKVAEGSEQQGFSSIFNQNQDLLPSFQEFPANMGYSEITFYTSKLRSSPKAFAWMMGNGVLYGQLDYVRPDSLLSDVQVWDYTPDIDLSLKKPISIVLTQFHFLLLLHDRVKAICTLNGQVVYEDVFPDKFGSLKRMIKDPVGGLVWIYTERAVFRYHIQREARDVWQMYMSMNKFDLAKEYCRDRPECMDMVLAKEAEHCFQNKRYLESAKCYALTQNYFEEIALKFIDAKQEEALKEFLLKKLNSLKQSERTQITLLVTWLAELYLNRLGQLESDGNSVIFQETREEFRQFLSSSKHKECLFNNRGTIYDLLANHGNVDDMVYFSVVMQDYERVISHYCQHDDYSAALDVLAKHCDEKLFYKFSPVLMQHIPKKVVDAWIQMGKRLDPKKLIPALMNYSQMGSTQQISETIRYMEFCVYELIVTEEAIHNYLLSLYAKYKPDSLLLYLEQAGTHASEIHYDLKYALRLCAEHGYLRACVLVYRIMELYEEAVDLALQVDVDLAKSCADLPEDDEELRKKLWLKIARHVVQEEKDVKKAMNCLSSCNLLKIEDILPFFPDFVTIDHFKEAICSSLEEYNQHIDELKQEMEEATESAKRIREDIQEMRNKYGVVDSQEKCAACDFPLLNRPFYLFLCGHMFHYDCLFQEVTPHLSAYKQSRLEELQKKLAATAQSSKSRHHQAPKDDGDASSLGKGNAGTSREQIKSDTDDIIASECVYCGELMIKSIDKPFIDPHKFEEEKSSCDDSDDSDDSDGALGTGLSLDHSTQHTALTVKSEPCEQGDGLAEVKPLNGVLLQDQKADKTCLYNFSKLKKNRKWLKNILLSDDTTDSDTDSDDSDFCLSREELHDMLRLHRYTRQHQSKFHSDRELHQYQYYSTGLLSTYDPFYEQQRHLLGPKKKKIKDEKKFKAKLKKVKKKKKRGEGDFMEEGRTYVTKSFAKFSHDAPLPVVKKKHLTIEQLNARRRKVWLTIAKKEIPKSFKQKTSAKNLVLTNAKKLAHQCMREVRRAAIQAQKNCKETLPRARRLTKEMMLYWKKYEKVEKEHRKRAEKEALEQRKLDEEMREAKRQQRKLNFLITQTELYAHFMSGKASMGGQGGDAAQEEILRKLDDTAAQRQIDIGGGVMVNMGQEDYDSEYYKSQALRNAKEAYQIHQEKTRMFDEEAKDSRSASLHTATGPFSGAGSGFGESYSLANPSIHAGEEIPQPTIFNGKLKGYQLKGMNWLANLYEQGINGILADEMGLGKTVQSIALLAHLAERDNIWGPFLIISPASTLNNWHQEFTRFVPKFKVLPYWGNPHDRKVIRKFWSQKTLYTQNAPFHVVITSYQLVVQDVKYFQRVKWQYMVLDEAQALKSSTSVRWKILLQFQCRNRLLLTGTPIQNTMAELWALLHFIMPTLFDSHDEFNEWFSKDIESHAENKSAIDENQLSRLHMILKPFMLRRIKKDVENELSDKIEILTYCQLTSRQRLLYQALRNKISIEDLLQSSMGTAQQSHSTTSSLMNLVMQFRKVCNHPDLFERQETRSPFHMSIKPYIMSKFLYRHGLIHSTNQARNKLLQVLLSPFSPNHIQQSLFHRKGDDKGSCFSFLRFIDVSPAEMSNLMLQGTLARWLALFLSLKAAYRLHYQRLFGLEEERQEEARDGEGSRGRSQPGIMCMSHKDLILWLNRPTAFPNTHTSPVLQFVPFYDAKDNYRPLMVGHSVFVCRGLSTDIFVFLLSTRAGGLGINLTAADTVIFYDSDWNPTVDQQAMDRAHRLGQTKQVTVYRLICQGSIEERILQRAKEKSEIQRVVISGGNFKPDTLKPKEVVSLLLDDDELEKKLRQRQEEKRQLEECSKVKERKRKREKYAEKHKKNEESEIKRKKETNLVISHAPSADNSNLSADGDDSFISVEMDSAMPSPFSEISLSSELQPGSLPPDADADESSSDMLVIVDDPVSSAPQSRATNSPASVSGSVSDNMNVSMKVEAKPDRASLVLYWVFLPNSISVWSDCKLIKSKCIQRIRGAVCVSASDTISPGRGRSGRSRGRPKGSGGGTKSGGKGRGRKSTAGSAAAMAGAMAGAAAASAAAYAAYGYSVSKEVAYCDEESVVLFDVIDVLEKEKISTAVSPETMSPLLLWLIYRTSLWTINVGAAFSVGRNSPW
ncbi:hypothetical protein F2P81_023911 [Scophthalmus maximus]|uniref:Chromatin-remodeling ATPase INO80 n=1 Tax=Scophthalmus maximus TaxID=52904 RepID=A0A6A4RVY2_SCOMX|nr:hypothetical protein F2P81_023911 [Scophthalmus maximus]